jgi:copper chaperone CopZ
MKEFCVRVAPMKDEDAARISKALRSVEGITAVEVDVFSGWVVVRGESLHEAELLAAVRACGFIPEHVLHDPSTEWSIPEPAGFSTHLPRDRLGGHDVGPAAGPAARG